MSFRFPLQKIVDLKGNEKTQAEWLLSKALSKLKEEEQFLMDLYEEIAVQQDLLTRSSETPMPIMDIQYIQEYISHLEKRIEHKRIDVQSAAANVQDKQSNLMDRSVDEKVWMKAREKAFNIFTTATLKKEQEDMDEMASNRHSSR